MNKNVIEKIGYGIEGKFMRDFIYKKHKGKCFYCDTQLNKDNGWYDPNDFNIDHLVPISKGGDNSIENLVASCFGCNSRKGSKTLQEFVSYLKEKNIPFKKNILQKMGGKTTFIKYGSKHMSELAKKSHKKRREDAKKLK